MTETTMTTSALHHAMTATLYLQGDQLYVDFIFLRHLQPETIQRELQRARF